MNSLPKSEEDTRRVRRGFVANPKRNFLLGAASKKPNVLHERKCDTSVKSLDQKGKAKDYESTAKTTNHTSGGTGRG